MNRPKYRSNQPTRHVRTSLPPWLHEWVLQQAARRYPDAPAGGWQGRAARLLRELIAEAYAAAQEDDDA